MLIEASVRPRNMKRGAKTKDLCKALGFKDEVGLSQMVGRLDLSAEHPHEFGLLLGLFNAFHPIRNQSAKITVEIDGKPWCTYTNRGADAPPDKENGQ